MLTSENRIEIDVSLEEILDDLLYPERSTAPVRLSVDARDER